MRQETSSVSPLSNSSPVPLASRGFSLSESPAALRPGLTATALHYLHLQDFRGGGATRDSGLLVLHYLDVVPLAGSNQVTQSECLLSQLRNVAGLESCSSTVRPGPLRKRYSGKGRAVPERLPVDPSPFSLRCVVAGARFVHSRHPDAGGDHPLGFLFILPRVKAR